MHFFPTIKNSLKTSDPKQLTDIVCLFLIFKSGHVI